MIKTLTETLQVIVKESYYQRNTADEVTYPYVVYSLKGEPLREHANGFYIDINIFDNKGHDDERIDTCLFSFMRYFEQYTQLTNDFLLQIQFLNSTPVPTGSDTLQRRNIQLYAKIDWRN